MIARRISTVSSGAALAALVLFSASVRADGPPQPSEEEYRQALARGCAQQQTIDARRRGNGGIQIDGRLDETDWHEAAIGTGFIQREPEDGSPSGEKTFFRIVYDDEFIYVGIVALDSRPDHIVGRLSRRDEYTPSDWLGISFDSYDDRRSAFDFQVNPAGVKRDRFWFNDVETDDNWDAVWDAATEITAYGWTAELRIPFSQLRYSGNGRTKSWGVQAYRQIHRTNEVSFWNHCPREANKFVSAYGRLEGLDNLPVTRNVEILPYAVGGVDTYGDPEDDPFRQEASSELRLGGDVKVGITSDITLNATINPDFGQVEQDPSEFNLTAFETYFEEKRPFFVEGANIFSSGISLGDMDLERLFYSRRIGRSPQFYPLDSSRWPDTEDFWERTPQFTKILGAAKVTGRTASGWSVGVLEALTDNEDGLVESPGGERYAVAVEPMTNYGVLSLEKDFNEGRSTIGGIATSVNRRLTDEDLRGTLNSDAYTGGMRFTHRWNEDEYQIIGKLYGSHIRGSREAILEAQTSPVRYFQRPDADHLGVDSTSTSLSGFSSTLWGGKFGGEPWRWGAGLHVRSPGFEINDIGFLQNADEIFPVLWVGYRGLKQGRIFREYSLNWNFWMSTNFGWENADRPGGNINGWAQFNNMWSVYGGINRNQSRQSNWILRGGPSMLVPGQWHSWHGFETDSRSRIVFGYEGNWSRDDEGYTNWVFSPVVTFRPSGRLDISLRPTYRTGADDRQYVDEIDGKYIVAHLDRTTLAVTMRLNLTLSPTMTLQLYGMPYLTAGRYSDYREVSDPRAPAYRDRFSPYEYPDNIDFNFKQLRTNLVYRWEFSPGSALFLVWSQGATDFEEEYGEFDLGRDFDRLFSTGGDNTFLIKINKWFSL